MAGIVLKPLWKPAHLLDNKIKAMQLLPAALQFGHFETAKPGEILDFLLGKSFFAGLGISFGVVTSGNGVIICSEPLVRSKGSGMDPPTH